MNDIVKDNFTKVILTRNRIKKNTGKVSKYIFILILFFLYIPQVKSITLYMKDIVQVNKPVTLDEIVSVKDTPLTLLNKIKQHTLSLSSNGIHLVPPRYIRDIVSSFTDQSVIIIGGRTVILPAGYFKNQDNEFIRQFADFLESALCVKKDNRVELEIVSLCNKERKSDEYVFSLKNKKKYLGYPLGSMQVFINLPGNYQTDEEIMQINVHQYIAMLKALVPIKRNEKLSEEKLFVTEEKLNAFTGEVLLPYENITEFYTTRKIPTGDIIYKSDVKKIINVKAGEKVTLLFRKGAIFLSMTGQAGESGRIGDIVKVRPSRSSEWITGRITGSREVLIEME